MGGDDGKRPEYVIAVVLPRHLRPGATRRYTTVDKILVKEIQNRGIDGDQCGHIIAFSLGGNMEYQNLFPHNKTSNRNQYLRAERVIAKFVGSTERRNPWALILVRLFYNNIDCPNRPTKICYSYFLRHDTDQNSSAENASYSSNLIPILPRGIEILVAQSVNFKVRTRVSPNKVKGKSNAESRQYWENWAIGLQSAASVVSLLGGIIKPAVEVPTEAPMPVPETVHQPVPMPVPQPVQPLVEPMQIWSEQLVLDRFNLSKPLEILACS